MSGCSPRLALPHAAERRCSSPGTAGAVTAVGDTEPSTATPARDRVPKTHHCASHLAEHEQKVLGKRGGRSFCSHGWCQRRVSMERGRSRAGGEAQVRYPAGGFSSRAFCSPPGPALLSHTLPSALTFAPPAYHARDAARIDSLPLLRALRETGAWGSGMSVFKVFCKEKSCNYAGKSCNYAGWLKTKRSTAFAAGNARGGRNRTPRQSLVTWVQNPLSAWPGHVGCRSHRAAPPRSHRPSAGH